MSKVAIIGGGAAGMLCGVYAARRGHQVHILEKNEKLGKKLFITGKGRCNVTNDSDTEELFPAVMSNRKFLYSAFYTYGSRDVMEFFRGGRSAAENRAWKPGFSGIGSFIRYYPCA